VTDIHVHRSTYTLRLSDVCLSRRSCLSREQRHRKTKIGTEVAHITRDSDITFKVKGQGQQAALLTAVLASQATAAMGVRTCWPWKTAATLPSAQPREAFRRQRGEEESGWCISCRLPAYSFFILTASVGRIVCGARRPWGETPMGRNVYGAKCPSMGRSVHGAKCPWGEKS